MSYHERVLLAVFAHPDDEMIVAGTLAYYRHLGVRIALACATRGEEGKIGNGANATPETIGCLREQELSLFSRVGEIQLSS